MIVEFKSNAPRRRLRPGSLFHRRTGDARSGEVEEYEWGGLRYRFSRAEHRELFKSNPKHYVPQFGNFCALALSKGELVEADPENWLISDGKLYVFGKALGLELFRKDLAANITKANQNRTLLPKH